VRSGYDLWHHLEASGIRVRVEDGKLLVNGALTRSLREDIAMNREYIIQMAASPQARPVVAAFEVKWAQEKGWISMRDPFTGEWHNVPSKGLPRWVYSYLSFKVKPRDTTPAD